MIMRSSEVRKNIIMRVLGYRRIDKKEDDK